eukprot:4276298-Amphidinium_carterae.2
MAFPCRIVLKARSSCATAVARNFCRACSSVGSDRPRGVVRGVHVCTNISVPVREWVSARRWASLAHQIQFRLCETNWGVRVTGLFLEIAQPCGVIVTALLRSPELEQSLVTCVMHLCFACPSQKARHLHLSEVARAPTRTLASGTCCRVRRQRQTAVCARRYSLNTRKRLLVADRCSFVLAGVQLHARICSGLFWIHVSVPVVSDTRAQGVVWSFGYTSLCRTEAVTYLSFGNAVSNLVWVSSGSVISVFPRGAARRCVACTGGLR